MKQALYHQFETNKKSGKKSFAVLIDPDKVDNEKIDQLLTLATEAKVDYFFVGGSLVISSHLDECIQQIKAESTIPVLLFPGSPSQVSKYADALLYLSLISGRNPELLIGQHVISAPFVKKSGLEIMPTGYMVIDEIAMCTAMAGEMLGMKLIYMDAGSGAKRPITEAMIEKVARNIEIPLIIGGGITEPEKAYRNCKAGADVIVVGNAIEKDPSLIKEISNAVHSVPVSA